MGVLDSVANIANKLGSKMVAPDDDSARGIKAVGDNVKQYMDATSGAPVAPKAPTASNDYDKINKKAKFGNRPGEKRPGPDGMPVYHKGTTSVAKTGPAIVKKGEAIIPAEHNPMNPENMFDKVAGMPAKKPAKVIDHLKVRKAASGGHIIEHHHTEPGAHKMEEHLAPTMKALHDHIDSHYGSPTVGMNDGNSPADPTAAMSEAVGGA